MRSLPALGAACLLAGCVQPEPVQPVYVPLQPYRLLPDYQPQAARPFVQPYSAPPAPYSSEPPSPNPAPPVGNDTGALPLTALPPPPTDVGSGAGSGASAPAPAATDAAPPVQKAVPTASGPGSNIPLEGFRPLHGVSRPTP